MAYGGESNAKKLARAKMWEHFASFEPASTMRAAVLCGPYGHDVRCATAHGFAPGNIVAVDTDASAIASARELLGESAAVWRVADFCDVVSEEPFDVVFMDACTPILLLADRVLPSLAKRIGSVFTDARGRDFRGVYLGVGGMYGRDGRFLTDDSTGEPDCRRTTIVAEQMRETAARDLAYYVPHRSYSYLSRRVSHDNVVRQTPMLYTSGLYIATHGDQRGRAFAKAIASSSSDCRIVHRSARAVRRGFLSESKRLARLQERDRGWRFSVERIGHDLDGTRVRDAAIAEAIGHGSAHAANVFCVDEGTVRAWLAHHTRGTYGNPSAEAGAPCP